MEIEEGLRKYKKYDIDKSLKYAYATATKDNKFVALVNNLRIKEKVAYKHTTKLQRAVSELGNCENCKGLGFCKNPTTGFIYYPEYKDDKLVFNYVACKFQKKILKQKKSAKYYELPYELQNASMTNVDITDKKRTKVIKWLKEFYDNYHKNPHIKGLYLHGSFGSGKTYLIIAMLNELAKKNNNIVAVYYPFLLRNLKESFNNYYNERIDYLLKADILLLDDVGAESITPWSRDEILGTILQYRMDNSLPTFLTSNLSIDELESHLTNTKGDVDKIKARRIVERIKQLTQDMELVSINRRK